MFNGCKNLRIRQKNYIRFYWCKDKKSRIILDECKNCLNRNLVRNKGIKKASNKRIYVKKEIYEKVLERDMGCQLVDKTCNGKLELHHIMYRSERKDLINDVDNCIMLCVKHHKEVHSNKKYWQPRLLELAERKKNGRKMCF